MGLQVKVSMIILDINGCTIANREANASIYYLIDLFRREMSFIEQLYFWIYNLWVWDIRGEYIDPLCVIFETMLCLFWV